MELKKKSESYWDDSAAIYSEIVLDELNSYKGEVWKELTVEQIGDQSGLNILDVGTGPGFFAILLSRMNHHVTAIDSSSLMIEQAKLNARHAGAKVDFVCGDLSEFPFDENSFDVIISRNVTWTLPHPEETYAYWYRLLRPGGKPIIFDANWNAHLVNPAIRDQYKRDQAEAKQFGIAVQLEEELEKEGDAIAIKLPLTSQHRPDWDLPILEEIGYRDIKLTTGFDERIYSEAEQILNRTTPMFALRAVK